MSVGSLYTAKDNRSGSQPLVLAAIVWPDGLVLRFSTHDLTGARQFGGHDWPSRILNGTLAAKQAVSESGVTVPPTMTLHLADPDGTTWATVKSRGLLGATLIATVTLLDVETGSFATDTYVPFSGRCNNPSEVAFDSITFTAESKLNLSRKYIPSAQIQRLCMWDFPSTLAERQKAAGPSDGSGICRCGYSADVGGGKGNLTGGVAFTSCGKTFGDCMQRMGNQNQFIDIDTSGRQTGTFSGVRFDPVASYWSKGYVSGQWEFGINSGNQGKYSQPVPLAYGLVRAAPPTTVVTTGDANLTANETILTLDQIGAVQEVVVSDTTIFPSGGGGSVIAGFWNLVNDGSRYGNANRDKLFDRKGDCYGSMAVIHTRVPKRLQDSNSPGNIQVLFQGRQIAQFAPGAPVNITGVTYGGLTTVHAPGHGLATGDIIQISGTIGDAGLNRQFVAAIIDADYFTLPPTALKLGAWTSGGTVTKWVKTVAFTSNPLWVLMDLLWWTDMDYSEMNLQWFYSEAAYCDVAINYTTVWGAASTHSRFSISLYLNQRRDASQLIRAVRLGFRCMLAPGVDGLITPRIEKTLAEQQPAPVLGSNYNAAIASVLADGTAANGYSAYDFNDSNILRKDGKPDGPPSLRITYKPRSETPNKLSAPIQDIENRNSIDSFTVNCAQAETLMGEEVPTTFSAEGINTYDQAQRVFGLQFAKDFLGNYTADYSGTVQAEWQAGPWALHLRVGDIV
ncbi:MAG TPA: hypothetical protein VNH18_10735, partial [Bryobacteraceae bacterium]|nr:hypothetical protein [Bryobacteraceae bacterium]